MKYSVKCASMSQYGNAMHTGIHLVQATDSNLRRRAFSIYKRQKVL